MQQITIDTQEKLQEFKDLSKKIRVRTGQPYIVWNCGEKRWESRFGHHHFAFSAQLWGNIPNISAK